MTTKEEFDTALATADQITVEGDDELLSYAVSKAGPDPENRIALDFEWSTSPALPPPPRRVWIIALAVAAAIAISASIMAWQSGAFSPVLLKLPDPTWSLVAIVAIVALFLIAWKAISSESNVTISWTVTAFGSGRVVITKGRERSTKTRAAA